MHLEIAHTDGAARTGVATLPRGSYGTPVFMPVGTQASVKAMGPDDLHAVGAEVILSNAYHLYLRPGAPTVRALGGLHGFMAWDGLILTDSGGYQIFSLKALMKIEEEGAAFRSHIDGSSHFLTPEACMQVQSDLGADIVMALDVCAPPDVDIAGARDAAERTARWAARCKTVELREHQRLFGIVQGGLFPDLRRESAEALVALDFPGYAVGGLSIGEPNDVTLELASHTAAFLPKDRPRYLMGVGTPLDILSAVAAGYDMFDCVLPTRMARNGTVFTSDGRVNLRNAAHREAEAPIESGCPCPVCARFSRAYLRHLFNCGEIMGPRLATFHNLHFYVRMMRDIRRAISEGRYDAFRRQFTARYQAGGEAS
jgi:queuine tRNA-ribosyltransferase